MSLTAVASPFSFTALAGSGALLRCRRYKRNSDSISTTTDARPRGGSRDGWNSKSALVAVMAAVGSAGYSLHPSQPR